jgi:hypothetical protein
MPLNLLPLLHGHLSPTHLLHHKVGEFKSPVVPQRPFACSSGQGAYPQGAYPFPFCYFGN